MTGADAEGLLELSHPVLGRGGTALSARPADQGRRLERLVEVEPPRPAGVIDLDQGRRGPRLLEGLGHHDRDRLVVMVDVGSAEQRDGVEFALAERAGVLRRDDRQHAGGRPGGRQVHGGDMPLGDRGAEDEPIGRLRHVAGVLVRVGRGARRLEPSVDAVRRLADDRHAVDRVRRGGSVELHGIRPWLAR